MIERTTARIADSSSGYTSKNPSAPVPSCRMFFTVGEAADLLRTSRKAVYAMVERGQLPGVTRLGRRVLIREDALLDWLRQKSTPSLER